MTTTAPRGADTLARVLVFVVLFELGAATARAIAAPDGTPILLTHVAAAARAGYAFFAVVATARMLGLARALGQQLYLVAASTSFVLAGLLAVVPLLDVVPRAIDDATWDTFIAVLFAVTFVAGVAFSLLVTRVLAERAADLPAARRLAGGLVPLLVSLPLAFVAIDPALAPAPWLAPALAIALPVALALLGHIPSRHAAGLLAALAAIAATIAFERTPGPFALAALSFASGLACTVLTVVPPLRSLAAPVPAPTPVPSPAPTPTPTPPAPAELRLLPSALAVLADGLRWCFIALVLRVLVVAFGFMWSASPLADHLFFVLLFHLALAVSGALFARGLFAMRAAPVPALAGSSLIALALALALFLCDLALVVASLLGPIPSPLFLADGVLAVLAVAAVLALIARLARPPDAVPNAGVIDQPRLAARARGALAILAAWSALAAATIFVDGLPASDINWLALPLGITTALVGLGLWIALLWLTHDARDALRR